MSAVLAIACRLFACQRHAYLACLQQLYPVAAVCSLVVTVDCYVLQTHLQHVLLV